MYKWKFTKAYLGWSRGDVIDPPTCLGDNEFHTLVRSGTLKRVDEAESPKEVMAKALRRPDTIETAEAPHTDVAVAATVEKPKRGRPRKRYSIEETKE